jgi:hypothetical protein
LILDEKTIPILDANTISILDANTISCKHHSYFGSK